MPWNRSTLPAKERWIAVGLLAVSIVVLVAAPGVAGLAAAGVALLLAFALFEVARTGPR